MKVKIKLVDNPEGYVATDNQTFRVTPDQQQENTWRLERIAHGYSLAAYDEVSMQLHARPLATEIRQAKRLKTLVMSKNTYQAVISYLDEPAVPVKLVA